MTPAGRLSVVGLGFGGGEQLTLAGHRALAESAWVGWFGMPDELKSFLAPYGAVQVDLDHLLRSDLDPTGFTGRAVEVVADAALRFGSAAVAVVGHPCCSNRAVPVLEARARTLGLEFRRFAAATAAGAYAERTGLELVAPGSVLLDARWVIERAAPLDARLAHYFFGTGYLAMDDRVSLTHHLRSFWPATAPVDLFRAGRHGGLRTERLAEASAWVGAIDYETTVVLAARAPGEDQPS